MEAYQASKAVIYATGLMRIKEDMVTLQSVNTILDERRLCSSSTSSTKDTRQTICELL